MVYFFSGEISTHISITITINYKEKNNRYIQYIGRRPDRSFFMKYEWNIEKRNMLKGLLSQGYRITEIEEMLDISRHTLRAELKRGLTESEFNNLRYIKYDPLMAMDSLVREVVSDEGLNLLMDYWKAKEKEEKKEINNVKL